VDFFGISDSGRRALFWVFPGVEFFIAIQRSAEKLPASSEVTRRADIAAKTDAENLLTPRCQKLGARREKSHRIRKHFLPMASNAFGGHPRNAWDFGDMALGQSLRPVGLEGRPALGDVGCPVSVLCRTRKKLLFSGADPTITRRVPRQASF
jgi:hypothetical protein